MGCIYCCIKKQKYIFKLYRIQDSEAAIQSTEIVEFLYRQSFPVVSIQSTLEQELYVSVSFPEGERVGVLYEYIPGKEPQKERVVQLMGTIIGQMHKLMAEYPRKLRIVAKQHYIGNFLSHIQRFHPSNEFLPAMTEYGNQLWQRVSSFVQGFTHGDVHTGNVIEISSGELYLLDFDIASHSFPLLDCATISDATSFVSVEKKKMVQTLQLFTRFLKGYEKVHSIQVSSEKDVLDCIALHHYELNGTIPAVRFPTQGNYWFTEDYIKLHYHWIHTWETIRREL